MDTLNIEYLSQKLDDEEFIKKTRLIKTAKYSMGAVTTKGTNPKRQINQDYSAIMTFPANNDLAMLIMADGKDNSANGKLAAEHLVHTLSDWFLSKGMSASYINFPVLLEGKLYDKLRNINRDLYNDKNIGNTSFALAIIGKNDTLIANVGNVRCYSINDEEINLQTTDDLTWYLYNDKNLINHDEVKYLTGKDYLARTIGKEESKHHFEPFINIIKNKDYDSLLLTTHGVNDVLDSKELFKLVKDNTTKNALVDIIYNTIFTAPKWCSLDLLSRFKNKEKMLIKQTVPGDSNASAIVYKKTKNS